MWHVELPSSKTEFFPNKLFLLQSRLNESKLGKKRTDHLVDLRLRISVYVTFKGR